MLGDHFIPRHRLRENGIMILMVVPVRSGLDADLSQARAAHRHRGIVIAAAALRQGKFDPSTT